MFPLPSCPMPPDIPDMLYFGTLAKEFNPGGCPIDPTGPPIPLFEVYLYAPPPIEGIALFYFP